MFNTLLSTKTQAHTIKVENCRDLHIVTIIIEDIIKEPRMISENNYLTMEDGKFVYGFECTTKEFENIKRLIGKFNRIDTIKMEAEIN